MKKFCSLPWIEAYTNTVGTYGVCCQENSQYNPQKISIDRAIEDHWNSHHMKFTRKAFMEDNALPQCQVCWTDEAHGKISMRQRRNHRYLGEPDPDSTNPKVHDLLLDTESDGHYHGMPSAFNFSVGTICQLRCIECSPSYSRSILKDYQRLNWSDSFKTRRDPQHFDILLDQANLDAHLWPELKRLAPHMTWLQITGGEPTVSRPLLDFLQWCQQQDLARNIKLLICTNAVNIKHEFIEAVAQFSVAIFSFSVDGHGRLDEYIRYPTKWEKKQSIIEKMMPRFPSSSICMAVGSLNINMIDVMIDWVLHHDYLLNPQIITVPDNLSMQHMPDHMKTHARQLLTDSLQRVKNHKPADQTNYYDKTGYLVDAINGMLKFLDQPRNADTWQETLDIVAAYDSIRPVPLGEINPWFRDTCINRFAAPPRGDVGPS